ncbi:hypothetical protein [Pseudomonas nitroreducens]|uniref:hypothetical protein n=1 Tax=Pseudomonas nitroreducens TaxID=46680 RepID=UPI00351D218E
MLRKRITAAASLLALMTLAGCSAIGQQESAKHHVATFEVKIKEVGPGKQESILYSPTITTLVGSTGEWRDLELKSGGPDKPSYRNGFIVAVHPKIDGQNPNVIGMDFVVDQFNPNVTDGNRTWSTTTSDISHSETFIYWQAGGKQYAASARLLRLD